jgi:two-component system nitrogen regulation response regulator NtrX
MISGHGTIETAVKATKLGAWDFIEKPLSMDKISIVISNILQLQGEKEEKQTLLNKLRKSIALIGETSQMVSLKQSIARCAPLQVPILLTGEKGTGRHLIAQNIHYLSQRAGRPLVEIHCSNLAEDLIDPELFGFEKGAFAGAERTQKGKLELAQGGTIFLDDISDLSLTAQDKFIKILTERSFTRLGGVESINVDVRIIVATSQDLKKKVSEGRFREELLNKLNVMAIQVPLLKDHPEDIPALVAHFSDATSKEGGFDKKDFSAAALKLMMEHSWPGNVRELKNFIERAYILTPTEFIDVHDLRFAGLDLQAKGGSGNELPSFRDARAQFEKEYLVKKIAENSGNISRTAEMIGLERSYLHRKIKSFGIEVQKGQEET